MLAVQLSTFVPRECGIATFTADLVDALDRQGTAQPCAVAAMDDCYGRPYGEQVRWQINEGVQGDYREVARAINDSGADLVNIQHEFGIFGGDNGEYLLDFLQELRLPVVTTLHTVLAKPSPGQAAVTLELARRSRYLVTMSQRAIAFLGALGVDRKKLKMIPHGVPQIPTWSRNEVRERIGLDGRRVFLTFGLLSPGKGLEYVLEAIPQVAATNPDILYLIAGDTHPKERRRSDYRRHLQDKVREMGIAEYVRFDPAYLSKKRLIEYLFACDAVVTPYLGLEQIVSGTLTYALGFGKAIISTRYHYATETLRSGRGLLVDFRDSQGLGKAMSRLSGSLTLQRNLEGKAYDLGRHFTWSRVATSYLDLYLELEMGLGEVGRDSLVGGVSLVQG